MASAAPTASCAKVLFFGRLKDAVGRAEASADLTGADTVESVFAQCAARFPQLSAFRASLAPSCNQQFVAWSAPVRPGDEIAFLPPVSGG